MNPLPGQMNLSWLDARIAETEARILSEKKQLAERESQGLNTGQLCRQLAITTDYLTFLNMRRDLLLKRLPTLNNSKNPGPSQNTHAQKKGESITPDQIAMVKASWRDVMQIRDKAAHLFYTKLFELDPSLKPLFTGNTTEQGKRLMQTLDAIVQKLDGLSALLPVLHEMAERHVAYGATNRDYETVGMAFLWTLKTSLGDAFTPDLATAWETVYMALSDAMQHDVGKSMQTDFSSTPPVIPR